MALPGKAQTYDLTTGVIVNIEDVIYLLSPTDVPLQGGLGADGASALSTDTCFEKKVEWLDEDLLLPKSLTAATTTTGDTFILVTTGQRQRFSTGDVLLVGTTNERMRVTGYGVTTDTLLVTRAFQSSTATTHITGVTVLVLGQALAEGSDPEAARAIDRNNRSNFTQIFGPTKVHVTGTENVVRKYGLGGTTEFDKQAANRTKEQYIEIEQALLYGKVLEDTGNFWRTMGGLFDLITTNVNSSTTTITEATLLDQMQATYDLGGSVDRLVMGSKTKRVISAFATSITINVARPDNVRGQVVDYFDSDFGQVTMILDRWCRTSDAFGFNRDQATIMTLRPMQFEMLAKTGDALSGQVLCEKTFKLVRQAHAFRFSALT
jgi:hypothetical protein